MRYAPYRNQVIEMRGGINENVSSLSLASGELIDCKNYMIAPGTSGGYRSLSGYERYDGAGTPSESGTTIVEVVGLTEEVVGSPNEFLIYDDPVLKKGTYGDDAVVTIELQDPDEVIAKGDTLTWFNATGTVDRILPDSVASDEHHGRIEALRIGTRQVPGEGAVLAVHIFENNVYAFRKAVGVDEINLYKEDISAGWIQIVTPTLTYDGTNDFRFKNYNFSANTEEHSMYWVDGVNQAMEFNGTTVTAIATGMVPDAPTHITVHTGFWLALGFRGGSLQLYNKGTGTWVGEYEFGMGYEIVELEDAKEDATLVFLQGGIKMLTGSTETAFTLKTVTDNANPRSHTVKEMLGTFFYVDDNGLTTLEATDQFGNYMTSGISEKFKKTLIYSDHEITTACISRDLNQYRIFFDDGRAIAVTFENQQLAGATILEYNRKVIQTTCGATQGSQRSSTYFIDGESGYVYKMDSGTSFDGEAIVCRLSTAFFHYGSPRTYKTFKRTTMEVAGEPGQLFSTKTEFDYNEGEFGPSIWYTQNLYNKSGTAIWGESRWGTMVWGAADAVTNRLYAYLAGVATNMSYKFISKETYRQPHVLQNIITDFTVNGRRV